MNGSSSKPLITTIIPTYCRPKLLKRAIRSVLNQTYPHFQVCVYDNASGDETASIVAELSKEDPRVKYHCHAENIGATENFIYGMEHIETPLFSFLSDDDFLLPNFFKDGVVALNKTPEAICFCGGTLSIDFEGTIIKHDLEHWEEGLYLPPNGLLEMVKKGHPNWQGTLFRKEVIDSFGTIDQEIIAGDYDYLLKVAAQKIIIVSKKPCGIFQIYPPLAIPRYKLRNYILGLFKVIKNINNIDSLSEEVKREVHQNIMKYIYSKVFLSGLVAISDNNIEDIEEAYRILNSKFTNTSKTHYFNLIYHSKYFSGKLIMLLRKSRPIRQIFRKKVKYFKYKKYNHLIDDRMILSYSIKWGYQINKSHLT